MRLVQKNKQENANRVPASSAERSIHTHLGQTDHDISIYLPTVDDLVDDLVPHLPL